MTYVVHTCSYMLIWPKDQRYSLKQAHDERSQFHAVAGELGTASDFGNQAVKNPSGWTCSRIKHSCCISNSTEPITASSPADVHLCHYHHHSLPILVEVSTTLHEWLRRWPIMKSSLWSLRPSSRIFWIVGHKCSRTRPAIVGLKELFPRRICDRGNVIHYISCSHELSDSFPMPSATPSSAKYLFFRISAAAKMSHDQIHRPAHSPQQTWRHQTSKLDVIHFI